MTLSRVIIVAKRARTSWGIINRARFGDCGPVSHEIKNLWETSAIRICHGSFCTSLEDEEFVDHTWNEVQVKDKKFILDGTVDQFLSSLDVDLVLKNDGIYFSHPSYDSDWLASRYHKNNH